MKKLRIMLLAIAVAMALAACDSDEPEITTTTADASQLTTTTSRPGNGSTPTTSEDGAPSTTVAPAASIDSHEIISRQSTEEGETLYILIPPGDYTDVSIENFLGNLLEDEIAVSGVELFDDRVALDAALKDEADRTADELQAIDDHHLVSLRNGVEVSFQGPMSEFDDFIIGS